MGGECGEEEGVMKKVGIITLHRSANYGSVLQAYALQEKIKSLGYKVKIIDYWPIRYTVLSMLKGLKNKTELLRKNFLVRVMARTVLLPSYLMRFRVFKMFVKKYLDLTDYQYTKEEDLEQKQPIFDIYCTGSDQVWNSEWNGGVDKPMFLSFAPDNAKKIAYAASFGKDGLAKEEIEETRDLLQRYAAISVRELDGVNIMDALGIKGSQCVLDPTLLLDGSKWREIASNKFEKEKYILVYNLNRNKTIHDYAEKLSRKTGYEIKYITYQLHDFYKKGKMYCNVSVEDYLGLIANAKYVVTDSFHGVAFSINFNRDFMVFLPGKYNSRLRSLLQITELERRIVEDGGVELLDDKIEYKRVNEIITNERQKSESILCQMLEEK